MDFIIVAIILVIIVVAAGFLITRKHPDVVHQIEDKIHEVKDHVEGIVSPPGKQPEIVASIPNVDTRLWVGVIPPKGSFLEDMDGRSYQLYVSTYQEFPPTKKPSEVVGIGVLSDLSKIRVNDGSGIYDPNAPVPSTPQSPSTNVNPVFKRERIESLKIMLPDPKTPDEIRFNELMAENKIDEAYKAAFKTYFRGMGGSGGQFAKRLEEVYGDPGYKHLVAKYN
jgi:hypothetical protein